MLVPNNFISSKFIDVYVFEIEDSQGSWKWLKFPTEIVDIEDKSSVRIADIWEI